MSIPLAPACGNGERGFGNGDSAHWLWTQLEPLTRQPGLEPQYVALLQELCTLLIAANSTSDVWQAYDAVAKLSHQAVTRYSTTGRRPDTGSVTAKAAMPFRVVRGGRDSGGLELGRRLGGAR